MGSTEDNESTRTEPPHLTDSCQSNLGWGLNVFEWCQIFALDSAIVKTQKLFSSHELFNAALKESNQINTL